MKVTRTREAGRKKHRVPRIMIQSRLSLRRLRKRCLHLGVTSVDSYLMTQICGCSLVIMVTRYVLSFSWCGSLVYCSDLFFIDIAVVKIAPRAQICVWAGIITLDYSMNVLFQFLFITFLVSGIVIRLRWPPISFWVHIKHLIDWLTDTLIYWLIEM